MMASKSYCKVAQYRRQAKTDERGLRSCHREYNKVARKA